MRILGLVTALLLLAACSPGGHRARRTETPVAGAPTAAPVPGKPSGTATPGVPPATPGGAPMEPPGEPGGAPPEGGERTHRVTLAIRGSVHRTTVTYRVPGERKKRLVVSPPWSKSFSVADGQDFAVRAHSVADGSLSCSVRVDGELLKEASSSGGDMTLDCGDSVG